MTQEELNEVLRLHKQWLKSNGNKRKRADLQYADLRRADLQNADLQNANLQYADLQNANLSGAALQNADLEGADLQNANLQNANLQYADIRRADLRRADLQNANLQNTDLQYAALEGADLKGADLDYSIWPLWCGSFDVKCDVRLVSQLAYHFCRLDCKDTEVKDAQNALLGLANKFHRVEECDVLKPKPVSKNENSKRNSKQTRFDGRVR